MNITVIHGQAHKGITYSMTHEVLAKLISKNDEIREFFLPKDGPDFCCGCASCFLKGEARCPAADQVQPIAKALEWADVILMDSPNYVMEMSGALKNLMDHLAYRWVVHRPHGSMFRKVGVVLCSSAGASAGPTTRSMAKQLKWMCVSKVYRFPFVANALGCSDLKPKKRAEMEQKAAQIARKILKRAARPRPSIQGRFFFSLFGRMQYGKAASWNPTDRDWWKSQGWPKNKPWKK